MFSNDYTLKFQRSYVAAGAAVVSVGVGVYKSIKANKAEKRDRAELARLNANAPEYTIQPEFEQNRNLAATVAANGMPSSVKNFYTSVAERGLSGSISAAQQAGGGINSLAELLDSHNQSLERMSVADSQMRLASIGDLINANSALAGQKLIKKFGVPNERWRNNVASTNRSIYADQASFDSGISDISSGVASFGAAFAGGTGGEGGGGARTVRKSTASNKGGAGDGSGF